MASWGGGGLADDLDVVWEAGQAGHRAARRDREAVTEVGVREPEPAVEPAAVGVPEGAVDRAVPAGHEQVDVVWEAGQARHRATRRDREAVTEVGVREPGTSG